LHKVDLNFFEI